MLPPLPPSPLNRTKLLVRAGPVGGSATEKPNADPCHVRAASWFFGLAQISPLALFTGPDLLQRTIITPVLAYLGRAAWGGRPTHAAAHF